MKWISSPVLLGNLVTALYSGETMQLASSRFQDSVSAADQVRAGWRLQRKIEKALVVNRLDINDVRIEVKGGSIALNGTLAHIGEIEKALTVVRAVEGVRVVKAALSIRKLAS